MSKKVSSSKTSNITQEGNIGDSERKLYPCKDCWKGLGWAMERSQHSKEVLREALENG